MGTFDLIIHVLEKEEQLRISLGAKWWFLKGWLRIRVEVILEPFLIKLEA
jgi:hypothetical protein